MKISNRFYVIGLLVAAMQASPTMAKTNTSELTGELDIMRSILNTALKQGTPKGSMRINEIGYTYLQGQGVLFNIDLNRYGSRQTFSYIDGHPSVPVAPLAPNVFDLGTIDIDIHMDEEEIENAMEQAEYLSQESNSKLRALSEKLRELSWQQREYERRRRDIEFEKNTSDKQRRAELEQQLTELNAELKVLETKRTEVQRYKSKTETERQEQVQHRKTAMEQEHKRFLANFEENLGQVLCRYGSGLRALDNNEYVNFVLADFTSFLPNEKGSQDRVYVFKHSDIQACVKDKIDQKTLFSNSQVYGF
ncbi:hypothetical protein [Paraglaciecola sp. 20A4]|uniref:hypothetical protein n=1 Tax=Paraglaciecola sp. 20A4 TaxID=2687288 RepID=UPI00140D3FD7|nr:hypothetical protein [Paraglaciecola sp. 20A4]